MHIMVCMDVWSEASILQASATQPQALQGHSNRRQQRPPAAIPAAAPNLGYKLSAASKFAELCMRVADR
jgi:hypothetical protein